VTLRLIRAGTYLADLDQIDAYVGRNRGPDTRS